MAAKTNNVISVMSIGAIAVWFRKPVAIVHHVATEKGIEPAAWLGGVPQYTAKQVDAIEKAVNKFKPNSPRVERHPVSPSWTRIDLTATPNEEQHV